MNNSTVTGPGRIEAEKYAMMKGVLTEPCSEGGRNVSSIDKGDWMFYPITITTAGQYRISYRVSSIYTDRYLSADYNAGAVQLGNVTIPNTGNWQTYTTVSHEVTLPAGTINFGLNGGNGGWNIKWFEIVWVGSSSPVPTLIQLNNGMHMTIQFSNNTRGAYNNSRIYVCVVARNASGQFSYLKPDGALIPITADQQSTSWTYKLSDINGFQVPSQMTSARLFISMDKAVVMRGIIDGGGNIGVVQPDLNNPTDPNVHTYFDWIEFTVSDGGYWGNTTQVDQFCFPITKEIFNKSGSGYTSYRKVGITKTREQIFRAFERMPQTEFRSLVKRPYRIVAPCKGDFRVGRPYGDYMKSYVDQVWDYFKSNTMSFSHPLGNFTGRVLEDDRFEFTRTSDNSRYYIARRPNNDELFEGSGVLATGNPVELALQAQVCAALNRHVFETPANWTKPSEYYKADPANFYAKFWHDNSLGGFAYGFCYDDVADQSTLIQTHSARGMVIGIGW